MTDRDPDTETDPAAGYMNGLSAWEDTVAKARTAQHFEPTPPPKRRPRYEPNWPGITLICIGLAAVAFYVLLARALT